MFNEIPEKKKKTLEKKGIYGDIDFSYLTPTKYYDFSELSEMTMENVGKYVAIEGVLDKVNEKIGASGRKTLALQVITEQGKLYVNYIGQLFLKNYLLELINQKVYVLGKLEYSADYKLFSMLNPIRITDNEYSLRWHTVYPKYSGVGEDFLQKHIKESLDVVEETLPTEVLNTTGLMPRKDALKALHRPSCTDDIIKGIKRNIFEDLLYFACSLEKINTQNKKESPFLISQYPSINPVVSSLPYDLTTDQKKVLNQLFVDAQNGKRLNALIQGDVGCGKSITAFLLMIAFADNGYQSVLMAPTVVLAKQHYEEFVSLIKNLPYKVVFLGGKQTAKEKREVLADIKTGNAQFVIGTHSVISDAIEYQNLALTVIDEEHRFGVKQREALGEKASKGSHTVSFSATPIPRSYAKTIYGDTDIYDIKTMPAGRKPAITTVETSEKKAIEKVREQLDMGHQAYVVCPLIDGEEDKKTVTSVAAVYEKELKVHVGIATGKQSAAKNEETLEKFKNGEIKVLVATTVIEVGVNVPNATVIVIESAERFGLAQLHQLRGRVKRGNAQGYCILISDQITERLQVLCNTEDGFEIAEADTKIRGAGNLIGEEQSGNNRFLQEAMQYPKMFETAKKYAKTMISHGTERFLIDEMERRSPKIFVKPDKIKIFKK